MWESGPQHRLSALAMAVEAKMDHKAAQGRALHISSNWWKTHEHDPQQWEQHQQKVEEACEYGDKWRSPIAL